MNQIPSLGVQYRSYSLTSELTLCLPCTVNLIPFELAAGFAVKQSCTIIMSSTVVSYSSISYRPNTVATAINSSAYARREAGQYFSLEVQGDTYLMPIHCLVPLPKFTIHLLIGLLKLPSASSQRSGVKSKGFGNKELSVSVKYDVVLTGVW